MERGRVGGMTTTATVSSSSSSSGRQGTTTTTTTTTTVAKATVAEQISQAVQSTSNLLHLMQHSSPSQAQLAKLPKNLLAKVSTIKNTGQALDQMPGVISSLDAHIESGLQSAPHLRTVIQLLTNMESCRLNPLSRADHSQEEFKQSNQPSQEA